MKKKIYALLSRRTTGNYFIPEIDGFRFFAIITVVLYHTNTHFSRIVERIFGGDHVKSSAVFDIVHRGSVGVDVFFAISGFILALPFARQRLLNQSPVSLRAYYIRRVTRLEPPYVISLLLFFLVHLLILGETFRNIFPNFLASLFYLHNIIFDSWSKINPVTWSLEVEVQFYVLAPFLATVFSIHRPIIRRFVLMALIIGGMLHYNFNYDWIEAWHLRKSLLMHLHQFLVGFLFADFFLSSPKMLHGKSYWFDVIGFSALALLLIFNEPFYFINDLMFAACLLLAFVAVFKGRLMNSFFTSPWIVIIGGMCYSIYLLHYAFLALLVDRTTAAVIPGLGYGVNFLIQALIVVPPVLLVSSIFFVLVERPCMDREWPSKLQAGLKLIFKRSTSS